MRGEKSRKYVYPEPNWLPSERDSKDGSQNIGVVAYGAYGRTHFRLRPVETPGEYGATCRFPGCEAHGRIRLIGTPFEKKLRGKNQEQPIPLPYCQHVCETRLIRIFLLKCLQKLL